LDDPQFIQANALLEDAERICFLGFGYDETNVQRLLGNAEKVKGLLYQMQKQWLGTALGFTQAEVQGIKARLPGGFNAYPGFNNLQFLRETGVLL